MKTEFEYINRMTEILQEVYEVNKDNIKIAAEKFAETMLKDKIIHTFGTGHSHMVGMEAFARAGGLGNLDAMMDPDVLCNHGVDRGSRVERISGMSDIIYDSHVIEKGDIMVIISNSGRNAMPVEMAMRCQKEGIYTIAITSLEQSEKITSRHSSGKKLYELCDLVLDNRAPAGDGCMNIGGVVAGAVSNITGFYLIDTITTEALKMVTEKGFKPYVYQSQNVDGYNNDEIYRKYFGRIKYIK